MTDYTAPRAAAFSDAAAIVRQMVGQPRYHRDTLIEVETRLNTAAWNVEQAKVNVEVTEEEAAHVLHCAGRDGGCSPGDFHAQLLALFIAADPDNTKRLALAFPGYAAAINLLYDGQVAQLQQIAEG